MNVQWYKWYILLTHTNFLVNMRLIFMSVQSIQEEMLLKQSTEIAVNLS
jgi:hypothetical protein